MKLKKYLKIKYLIIAAIIAVVGFFIVSIIFPAPVAPNYITTKVFRGNIEQTVLADGTISAYKQVSVGAQVSGQIKKLYVVLGQSVTKDQLIAEIDDLTQQNNLKQAEASLTSLEAQRTSKEATLRNYQLTYDRQLKLVNRGAGAQSDLDEAQAQLDAIRADIKALDANIISAQIAVDTAQLNLGYTKIVSPMDGVIVAIPVEEGQTVNSVQSAPTIVKVAQLDKMTVEAQISEADVINVKEGMPVYFTILGRLNQRYDGLSLRAIEPAPDSINTETSTSSSSSSTTTAIYYNGLFDVDNPEQTLRISMTAQVYIVLASAKDVILVPSMAIQGSNGLDEGIVYVVDSSGNAVERTVKLGINNNINVEILSGLNEGETVIISSMAATVNKSGSAMPRLRM
ncbi:efflux RND transporter periplasmic adaptor subunit [Zophobihabitans entericus]|uniref:Efflux RND transporter periplasmic adaptor subunit n=1 Tax=Zophobihabitans entericus TaxID=1635327 RepID=A0A6G9IES4_9GAMM|nr:efflux RND transporter periplasmic adaptor subunit [Zophobihabitans entericus]QIQ22322.1 efflux RND transporter periplasmic adaptor subunit [Zophobihabitans entericus]